MSSSIKLDYTVLANFTCGISTLMARNKCDMVACDIGKGIQTTFDMAVCLGFH